MRKQWIFGATLLAMTALAGAQPRLSVVPGEQMRADLTGSFVERVGNNWRIVVRCANDNDAPNGVLPSGFRRQWHFRIEGLDPDVQETLNIEITNTEYTESILPTWSLDGGATYERVPVSAQPVFSSGAHRFTLTPPLGQESIRVSKYYPYTFRMFEEFQESIRESGNPHWEERVIGESEEGRPIYLYEFTNRSVPDAGKRRAWIHSAVHPSENTAFFNCEGLIEWLLSGELSAERTLENLIITVVPMANPDGVWNGNYRTNALSVNIEPEWRSPYQQTVAEIVALRTEIERIQGTPENPGETPIELLLNLHATHGLSRPFHFVHTGNYFSNGTGVTPEVRALELKWVGHFRARNAFVNRGNDQSSGLSGRPFVESMMHDRYTLNPQWPPVMAITFEGTYQLGPIDGIASTREDYTVMGRDMGLAIADYFDVNLEPDTSANGWVVQ